MSEPSSHDPERTAVQGPAAAGGPAEKTLRLNKAWAIYNCHPRLVNAYQRLSLLFDPLDGLGLDRLGGARPDVFSPATRQPADDADRHVVIADDLTAEPHARQTASGQDVLLGGRHPRRLTRHEFDAAGRAAGVAAAGMQLIDLALVLQRQHKTFPQRHFKIAHAFDR
jgi:hypothetical protein